MSRSSFSALFLGATILIAAGISASGCQASVDAVFVSLLSEGDGASNVSLRESPPQRRETEGHLLAETGRTPTYSLRPSVPVDAEGGNLYFTMQDLREPVRVVVSDSTGAVVATREFGPPADFPSWSQNLVAAAVAVPGGSEIGSFFVQTLTPVESDGTVDESRAAGPRLVAVTNHTELDYESELINQSGGLAYGNQGAWRSSSGLVMGQDTTATEWNVPADPAAAQPAESGQAPETDDERSWALSAGSWIYSAPFELLYRYEPNSTGVALVEPSRDSKTIDPELPNVRVAVGARRLILTPRPGTNSVVIYPDAGADSADRIHDPGTSTEVLVSSEIRGFQVLSLRAVRIGHDDSGLLEPIPADLGTILRFEPEQWRDRSYEIFRWTLFPGVFVFDTINYEVQSRFFKRLAFFAEKEGFRGQILSNADLSGRHGYNAHNYDAASLAEFFSAVSNSEVDLYPEEQLLREALVDLGVIRRQGTTYGPGEGGILSISQASATIPGLRDLLLRHESFHGVFYANSRYRDAVSEIWTSLSPDEQRFWTLFLDALQYDVTSSYLVSNEFHAYLLQQPLSEVSWYFEVRSADRLRGWKPGEAAWINEFLSRNAGAFYAQGAAVNGVLRNLTGLAGGDVYCLVPEPR